MTYAYTVANGRSGGCFGGGWSHLHALGFTARCIIVSVVVVSCLHRSTLTTSQHIEQCQPAKTAAQLREHSLFAFSRLVLICVRTIVRPICVITSRTQMNQNERHVCVSVCVCETLRITPDRNQNTIPRIRTAVNCD